MGRDICQHISVSRTWSQATLNVNRIVYGGVANYHIELVAGIFSSGSVRGKVLKCGGVFLALHYAALSSLLV